MRHTPAGGRVTVEVRAAGARRRARGRRHRRGHRARRARPRSSTGSTAERTRAAAAWASRSCATWRPRTAGRWTSRATACPAAGRRSGCGCRCATQRAAAIRPGGESRQRRQDERGAERSSAGRRRARVRATTAMARALGRRDRHGRLRRPGTVGAAAPARGERRRARAGRGGADARRMAPPRSTSCRSPRRPPVRSPPRRGCRASPMRPARTRRVQGAGLRQRGEAGGRRRGRRGHVEAQVRRSGRSRHRRRLRARGCRGCGAGRLVVLDGRAPARRRCGARSASPVARGRRPPGLATRTPTMPSAASPVPSGAASRKRGAAKRGEQAPPAGGPERGRLLGREPEVARCGPGAGSSGSAAAIARRSWWSAAHSVARGDQGRPPARARGPSASPAA